MIRPHGAVDPPGDDQAKLDHLVDPAEDLIRRLTSVLDEAGQLIRNAETQAAGQLATTAAAELPRAINRMVAQSRRKTRLYELAAVGVVLLGAVALGYLLAAPPKLDCVPQNGGVMCYRWLQPPTTAR